MIVCVILLLLPAHSSIIGRKRSSFSNTNTLSILYHLGSLFLTLSGGGTTHQNGPPGIHGYHVKAKNAILVRSSGFNNNLNMNSQRQFRKIELKIVKTCISIKKQKLIFRNVLVEKDDCFQKPFSRILTSLVDYVCKFTGNLSCIVFFSPTKHTDSHFVKKNTI